MYALTLYLHSYLRWAVVLLLAIAAVRAFAGWRRGAAFGSNDRRICAATLGLVDLQLLIGLVLYFGLSPITRLALSNMKQAMRNPALRFWAVEHLSLMLAAVSVVHVGRVLARKAAVDAARHKRIALSFSAALLLMLAAIPWPFRQMIGRALFPH